MAKMLITTNRSYKSLTLALNFVCEIISQFLTTFKFHVLKAFFFSMLTSIFAPNKASQSFTKTFKFVGNGGKAFGL